jgi:hypothetical protein
MHYVKAEFGDGNMNNSIKWTVVLDKNASCKKDIDCIENIGCGEWSECKKSNQDTCRTLNLKPGQCGTKNRNCKDLNNCNFTEEYLESSECQYNEKPSCHDNIKNCHDSSCEVLTDCGGVCNHCPTCSDGIKNQDESGIDCGGFCQSCLNKTLHIILNLLKSISKIIFVTIFLGVVFIIIKLLYKNIILKNQLGSLTNKE